MILDEEIGSLMENMFSARKTQSLAAEKARYLLRVERSAVRRTTIELDLFTGAVVGSRIPQRVVSDDSRYNMRVILALSFFRPRLVPKAIERVIDECGSRPQ
jgi:hypothetical protein